jgi:hypothetical protein
VAAAPAGILILARRRSLTLIRTLLLLFAVLLFCSEALEAQAGTRSPISTGRPSFATGPGIVSTFQVESGYLFTDASPTTDQHTLGQVMLRFPVVPRVEFRAGLGSLTIREAAGAREQGFQDVTVGAKLLLVRAGLAGSLVPGVTILGSTSLPVAGGPFGNPAALPAANLILAWPIGERAQLLSNTIARSRYMAGERVGEVAQGAYLGYSLPGPFGAFAEVYGSRAEGQDIASSAGVGLTLRLSRDLQLDVHGGFGLSAAAADRYLGAGVGWRR